jgi:hypothetical protein
MSDSDITFLISSVVLLLVYLVVPAAYDLWYKWKRRRAKRTYYPRPGEQWDIATRAWVAPPDPLDRIARAYVNDPAADTLDFIMAVDQHGKPVPTEDACWDCETLVSDGRVHPSICTGRCESPFRKPDTVRVWG